MKFLYWLILLLRYHQVNTSLLEGDIDEVDSDSHDDRPKASMSRGWETAPTSSLPSYVRSFACEKHSKWKKKCPVDCPLRKQQARVPMARRKLWSKNESALLVHMADELHESDVEWEAIARTFNRSVSSTKKKFMRYRVVFWKVIINSLKYKHVVHTPSHRIYVYS